MKALLEAMLLYKHQLLYDTHLYIYIYIKKERDRESEREKERERFVISSATVIYVLLCHNIFTKFLQETDLQKSLSYLPTPPLGPDMTQGQFLSGV